MAQNHMAHSPVVPAGQESGHGWPGALPGRTGCGEASPAEVWPGLGSFRAHVVVGRIPSLEDAKPGSSLVKAGGERPSRRSLCFQGQLGPSAKAAPDEAGPTDDGVHLIHSEPTD